MAHPTPRKNLDGNVVSLEKYLASIEAPEYDGEFDDDEDDALAEDSWEASREREREEGQDR